jgi:uncharacterized protein YdeI (YjbR/CyaY-like superfamily)
MNRPIPEEKLLRASTRSQWRAWLKKNHKTQTEIWLVYPKKQTGRPRIAYNDAVEEALCYGWIDSTVRSIDDEHFAQRFSVRRPGSKYSQANLERLRALAASGKILPEVLSSLPNLEPESFTIAEDILESIRSSPTAWRNFRKFPPAYIRIRIAYIEGARGRPAEFEKRLAHFVRKTEQNKQFGFGGIEKHYR